MRWRPSCFVLLERCFLSLTEIRSWNWSCLIKNISFVELRKWFKYERSACEFTKVWPRAVVVECTQPVIHYACVMQTDSSRLSQALERALISEPYMFDILDVFVLILMFYVCFVHKTDTHSTIENIIPVCDWLLVHGKSNNNVVSKGCPTYHIHERTPAHRTWSCQIDKRNEMV